MSALKSKHKERYVEKQVNLKWQVNSYARNIIFSICLGG